MREGLLIVVSGPSGVGKGTVCQALIKGNSDVKISVSMTTRSPRQGEVEGKSYFFTTKDVFRTLIEEDSFLEWAEVYGDYYGTPRRYLEEQRLLGQDILLEIDTQGARQVKAKFPEGIFIFLLPPSLPELKSRIMKRGTESLEAISTRLDFALEEMQSSDIYNYVVLNDSVEKAVHSLSCILEAEKCAASRNKRLITNILKGETW